MKFLKIIIPCYNCEKTINKMVDSILNQTCKDFFIVLVDDMSTDGTYKILKEYEQKYPEFIKAVQVPEKSYADGAREFGFKQYDDAEFTWFVDADDQLANNNVIQTLKDVHQQQQKDLYTFNCNKFKFGYNFGAMWFRITKSSLVIIKLMNIVYGEDMITSFLQYDSIPDNKIYHINKILYNYSGRHAKRNNIELEKVKKTIVKYFFKKSYIKRNIKQNLGITVK